MITKALNKCWSTPESTVLIRTPPTANTALKAVHCKKTELHLLALCAEVVVEADCNCQQSNREDYTEGA
jgi:hypothetical protein